MTPFDRDTELILERTSRRVRKDGGPNFNGLPEPYASLRPYPEKLKGWFTTHDPLLKVVHSLAKKEVIIELGSWLGASTIFFAGHFDKVYAVDTWQGSVGHQMDKAFSDELPTLYSQFLSNMIHAGITEKVVPLRMTTMEAALVLAPKADLIFVDAAHDAVSVFNEVLAWYPRLNEGGVMVGDDATWTTVLAGLGRAAEVLGKRVAIDGNLWRLVTPHSQEGQNVP